MNDETLDIFADLPEEAEEEVVEEAPAINFVTVRYSGGDSTMVPNIDEPKSIREILDLAHITIGTDTALFVDSVSVAPEFLVGPGATVSLFKLQKGG